MNIAFRFSPKIGSPTVNFNSSFWLFIQNHSENHMQFTDRTELGRRKTLGAWRRIPIQKKKDIRFAHLLRGVQGEFGNAQNNNSGNKFSSSYTWTTVWLALSTTGSSLPRNFHFYPILLFINLLEQTREQLTGNKKRFIQID